MNAWIDVSSYCYDVSPSFYYDYGVAFDLDQVKWNEIVVMIWKSLSLMILISYLDPYLCLDLCALSYCV